MASAWGTSFGPANGVSNAWGVSWGFDVVVVVQEDIQGRGSWDKLRGRKKKPKTLRYSELEERERLAQELAMASIAIVQPKNPVTVIEEPDDDDETILFALISRLEH